MGSGGGGRSGGLAGVGWWWGGDVVVVRVVGEDGVGVVGSEGVLSWAVGVYFGSGIMVADFLCGLVCEVDAGLLSSKKSQKSVESI